MLSVVFPQSLEIRLIGDLSSHLMRIQEVLLFDDLRSQLVEGIPLGLEFGSTLLSSGVDTEHDVGGLIGIVERVKLFVHVVDVTIVSKPVDLRLLIEEESG